MHTQLRTVIIQITINTIKKTELQRIHFAFSNRKRFALANILV